MEFYMITTGQPKSYNVKKKMMGAYINRLKTIAGQEIERLTQCTPDGVLFNGQMLYSNILYFHRVNNDIDADNLSKPILDALKNVVFRDDVQIIKRTAMKVNLNADFTLSNENIPDHWYSQLIEVINDDTVKHLLFIEVGTLDELKVAFGR